MLRQKNQYHGRILLHGFAEPQPIPRLAPQPRALPPLWPPMPRESSCSNSSSTFLPLNLHGCTPHSSSRNTQWVTVRTKTHRTIDRSLQSHLGDSALVTLILSSPEPQPANTIVKLDKSRSESRRTHFGILPRQTTTESQARYVLFRGHLDTQIS